MTEVDPILDLTAALTDAAKKGESGPLRAVLGEPEIRSRCLALFREHGCPPLLAPIVLYSLEKVILGSTALLGEALQTRLVGWCQSHPLLGPAVRSIARINADYADEADARMALVRQLDGLDCNLDLDAKHSMSVIAAIHQGTILRELREAHADITGELMALHGMLNELRAPIDHITLRIPEQTNRDTPAARLVYRASYKLIGREELLSDWMQRLAGDPSLAVRGARFRWMLVTGDGGMGKTHMALEFTRRLRAEGWDAGFLSPKQLLRFDPEHWRPRFDTLMVVDYPALSPTAVRDLLRGLLEIHTDFDFRVHVLLLERDAEGAWTKLAFPTDSTQLLLEEHGASDKPLAEFPLPSVAPEMIAAMMAERITSLGGAPPKSQDLINAVASVDALQRPLFALATAEFLVEVTKANPTREQVLGYILEREESTRWHPSSNDDNVYREACKRMLMLATITLSGQSTGITILSQKSEVVGRLFDEEVYNSLPSRLKASLPEWPASGRPGDDDLLREMGAGLEHLPALEPDILGEYFVFHVLRNQSPAKRQLLIDAAFEIGEHATSVFILRVLRDFPDAVREFQLFKPSHLVTRKASAAWASVAVSIPVRIIHPEALSIIDQALEELRTLRVKFADDVDFSAMYAEAMNSAHRRKNYQEDWGRCIDLYDEINDIFAIFSESERVAVQVSGAALTKASKAGDLKYWDDLKGSVLIIYDLHRQFPNSLPIARRFAIALANQIIDTAGARLWVEARDARKMLLKLAILQSDFEVSQWIGHGLGAFYSASVRASMEIPQEEVIETIIWAMVSIRDLDRVAVTLQVLADALSRLPQDHPVNVEARRRLGNAIPNLDLSAVPALYNNE